MPYKHNSELPKGVQNNLPDHAQTIYRDTFNSAWDQYKLPKKRELGGSREEVSHRVAWASVEKKYIKDKNGNWIEIEKDKP